MTGMRGGDGIVQNCYVVRDLEAACARFHTLYGIGPFLGGIPIEMGDHVHRGRPAEPIRLRGVFVHAGDINIELTQILSDGPSAFRDMFPDGGEGFHHVAKFCDDYELERDRMVAVGGTVASEFMTKFGARVCYIDPGPLPGHMIELYPEHPGIRAMYARAREAAESWDRQRLIIPWTEFDLSAP